MEGNPNESSKAGVIGCVGFLYAVAAMFLAAAWFGLPFGNNHGLNVLAQRDLVYTTGKVIRFESMATSSHPGSRPIVEIPYGNGRFRFSGEGEDSHPFSTGDDLPVAYPAGHPERAYLRTFRQMYFGPLLMVLFALPFFAMALWGTVTNLPRRDAAIS
jgi:hypothetical protein